MVILNCITFYCIFDLRLHYFTVIIIKAEIKQSFEICSKQVIGYLNL